MRVVVKHRDTKQPSTPAPARRISSESVIQELEEAEKYATVRTPAAKTESSSAITTEDSMDDGLSARQRRKRRRSYISPGSNAPSLSGGAQRILTPTRQLQHESDDGGMDGDLEGATPEISAGPRRVSVLAQRRKSEEGAAASTTTGTPFKAMQGEQVKEKEQVASRETISLGSIGAALRVPHRKVLGENDGPPVIKEAQVKELQQPLSVRVTSAEDTSKADAGSPRAERKLVFAERVPLKPVQQSSRTSIDRTASRKSISSRTSLDDSKPVQSLSERLAGNPKWEMDDFIVTKNLGQGKFGNVYLAKEKCSNVTVALKVSAASVLVQFVFTDMKDAWIGLIQGAADSRWRCQ
jgi:hypothetical protein